MEVVISSDDGFDYSSILPQHPAVIYAEPALNTGPANARNRALNAATGRFVCMMDADDAVSAGYCSSLIAALELHKACVVRSVYVRNGQPVRALQGSRLTIESFCAFFGSVIVAAPRIGFPQFQDVVAEDGVATLVIMANSGGTLPIIDAEYRITLHDDSYCAKRGHEFTGKYASHLLNAAAIALASGSPDASSYLDRMYSSRLKMSKLYDAHLAQGGILDYHAFILDEQSKGELLARIA